MCTLHLDFNSSVREFLFQHFSEWFRRWHLKKLHVQMSHLQSEKYYYSGKKIKITGFDVFWNKFYGLPFYSSVMEILKLILISKRNVRSKSLVFCIGRSWKIRILMKSSGFQEEISKLCLMRTAFVIVRIPNWF